MIAAVVSAAALLALGASMTSFAAAKGTWMMEDGEWKCYDKNGDEYTNIFCSSNGKEYYVGDDGLLVRSDWVEYDGEWYFVNSSGAKITNDWRLTTPHDDESADEEWYYFQSSGKMATNKKVAYKGKTYYFDTDGKMLTGWITDDGTGTNSVNEANDFDKDHTYYCDETGARVANKWVKDIEPGTAEDDADADEYWYWLKSSGKAATGKQANIKGQLFFFDAEGRMLTGWVAATAGGYEQIDKEDEERAFAADEDIYYCAYDEDSGEDGHAKRNRWVKTWLPLKKAAAEDDDLKWFWFDKNGKLYRTQTAVASKSDAFEYDFKDGKLEPKATDWKKVSRKKVNAKDYWFDNEGVMLAKFYLIGDQHDVTTHELYYFGGADDGSMKTGSQSIKDDAGDTYKFYFYTKNKTYKEGNSYNKGAGVTGNQNNKLYWYGRLVQAEDYKYQMVEIDVNGSSNWFIVNANGAIQHGRSEYKEDGDILINTSEKEHERKIGYKEGKNDEQFKYSISAADVADVQGTKSGLPDVSVNDLFTPVN